MLVREDMLIVEHICGRRMTRWGDDVLLVYDQASLEELHAERYS